jgi:hypothetical protein
MVEDGGGVGTMFMNTNGASVRKEERIMGVGDGQSKF